MAGNTEQRLVEIVIKGQQANATLKEIEAAGRAAKAQLKGLATDSAEFAAKSKDLTQINKRLKSINDDIKGVGGVFQKIGNEVKAFGIIAVAALGFQFITDKVSNLISQNSKLSDSFADIRKTTGMTETEVKRLNNAFSQMNTRTTTKELRDIAVSAGQLGIAKKDILAFTAATDKLVVSLGDEFSGGAEQVTKEMGALRNVFTDIKSNDVSNDMLHIGNAINELGAAGAATGPVVADFANRIGGVGINLGLTSGQVLGLSATLQELNVSTERGGTAITKILMKMTQETEKFATVAGMSAKDFQALVNEDLYGAFVKVAEGAKKGGTSATEFSKILDSLGVDGAGASEVFSKLGSNTGLLKEKVDLANKSLKGTDSIMNEFSIKNDTFAGKIEKIGKAMTAAFVNGPIMEGLESIADTIVQMIAPVDQATEAWRKQNAEIQNLEDNAVPLIDRYDELKGKTQLTKEENTELNTIIESLSETIPVAVTEWDAYGKALGVNTSIAREFIAEQKAMLAVKNKQAITEQLAAMYDLGNQIEVTTKKLNAGVKEYRVYNGARDEVGHIEYLKLTNEELLELRANLVNLQGEMKGRKGILAELMGNKTEAQQAIDEAKKKKGSDPVINSIPALDPDIQKKAKKEYEEFLNSLKKLDHEYYLNGLSYEDRRRAVIEGNYQADLKKANGNKEAIVLIEKKRGRELYALELELKEKQDILDAEELKKKKEQGDKLTAIAMDQQKSEIKIYELSAEEKLALYKDYYDKYAGIVNDFMSGFNKILDAQSKREDQRTAKELKQNEKRYEREEKENAKLLKAKLIDQTEYDKRMKKAAEDKDKADKKLKKEAFEREQKIARFRVLIAGAQGIAQIWAEYAGAPYIAAALTLVEAAAIGMQLSAIDEAPQPYAKGGFNKRSNDPQGFTTGPTLYTNSASGKDFIAGEAGQEWISPSWMVEDPRTAPIIEHLESIRVGKERMFASGGSTSTTPAPVFSGSSSSGMSKDDCMLALASSINTLNGLLASGIEANLVYDNFKRTLDKIDFAKNSALVK